MAKDSQVNTGLELLFAAARLRVSKGHNDTCQLLVSSERYGCNCGHDALGEALEALGQDQNTIDCTHKKG